jgi:capsular exopolysaccharide synthesis family protein
MSMSALERPPAPSNLDGQGVVTLLNPRSSIAEAYRDLRTSLKFARLDEPLKVVVVTSSGPGEGKSTTVANLGVVMAHAGSRVLLVDADLRRPSLDKYFGFNNQFGLTNALFDDANLNMYIRSTPLENLKVLTSGPLPPNPSELLGAHKMKTLLDRLREEFDCVVIDTPPVGTISDALVLSPECDGVVMVVQAGGLPREVIQRCKTRLDSAKARILGVVLNKVDIEREKQYYYYYNYYAGYYGYGQPGSDQESS